VQTRVIHAIRCPSFAPGLPHLAIASVIVLLRDQQTGQRSSCLPVGLRDEAWKPVGKLVPAPLAGMSVKAFGRTGYDPTSGLCWLA
jgi:hypothetical protein